jgi:hypothetical protein
LLSKLIQGIMNLRSCHLDYVVPLTHSKVP